MASHYEEVVLKKEELLPSFRNLHPSLFFAFLKFANINNKFFQK